MDRATLLKTSQLLRCTQSLQRLRAAKVTFKLTQGHWQSCDMPDTNDRLLVLHYNYVYILHLLRDYHLFSKI